MDVTECRLRLEAEEMSEVVASQSPRSPSRRHAHLGDAVRWDHYSACLSVGGGQNVHQKQAIGGDVREKE